MANKCIEKLPHSCGSRDGLQVFQKPDGAYDGYCYACGKYVENPYKDKPNDYRPPPSKKKSEEEIRKEIEEISNYKTFDLPTRKLRKESLGYFGIKIGVSEQDGETPILHYYPYRVDNNLVGYKARWIKDKKIWGIGRTNDVDLFGWDEALKSGGKKLFITEGELDAVALYQIFKDKNKGTQYEQMNPPVVSLPNGAGNADKVLAKHAKKIREYFKEIVLVFDMDDPGRDAVKKVMTILPEAVSAALPAKDVNECLIQGRSIACYNAIVFNAKKPKNTRIVDVGSVLEKARQEVEWGFSWPYSKLTDLTRGIRVGETYYLGAGVKMGKSELLNDIAAHCITAHKWKIFVVKPEESNARTLQGIAGKIAKKIFHDPKIPFDFEAFDATIPLLEDNLFMLNLYQELSWEGLKEDIKSAVIDGCKAIFIDPITVLSNGINSADANTLLQKMAQELAALALEMNFVAFMFAHLKAPDFGQPHERGGAVQSQQFAGSRAMMRSAHLLIGLEGNKDPDLPEDQRNLRSLVLLENRMSGETGRIPLFYDKNTGQFNEL